MKKVIVIIIFAAFMIAGSDLTARPSIGGFNVYYGHLHNHCNISDGWFSPDYAYRYARNNGRLDFFSLSDHSTSMTASEWADMKAAADKYNESGVFTAFWGFEWTENVLGHVTIINSADYITTAAPANTFTGLCNWLNKNECVAFFNHPGRNNSTGKEFSHFATIPSDKIVGMELWNKTQRFEKYYYTDGYYTNDGNLGCYDEALTRGWKIGAAGSEDNHFGTWGNMTDSRLAVLASSNNRAEIMNALKARRFFSTYDKNLALSFKIDGEEMGSTVTGGTCDVQILASDADNEIFDRIELIRNGFVIKSWDPGSSNPVIRSRFNCSDGEYYYIRVIQQDGDQAISSPIRISDGSDDLYYHTITPTSDNITGKDDYTDKEETILFPNPARDVIFVDRGKHEIRGIEIYSLDGQPVKAVRNSDRISVKNLVPGIYTVRLTFENNSFTTKKIVISE